MDALVWPGRGRWIWSGYVLGNLAREPTCSEDERMGSADATRVLFHALHTIESRVCAFALVCQVMGVVVDH